MDLLRAEHVRRRIYHWLIPPISLWVLILFGLASYGAEVARAENTGTRPKLSLEGNPSRIRNSEPAARLCAQSAAGTAFDETIGHTQESATIRASTALLIDGDPDLLAHDLLPPRATAVPPQRPLFLNSECQTPMSLMLHSSFGTERMRLLAREILAQGVRTTTYREITERLREGNCPASNSLIVSLDDFGTDWLRPHFQSMIRAFTDRGLSLVVASMCTGLKIPTPGFICANWKGWGTRSPTTRSIITIWRE